MSKIPQNDNPVLAKIKRYCEIRGLSIYKLAKYSDIPYSSLNNIFLRNTQPTVPTLEKICNGLGISISEFFEEDIIEQPEVSQYQWLSPEEQEIIDMYHALNRNDKNLLKAYLQGLSSK